MPPPCVGWVTSAVARWRGRTTSSNSSTMSWNFGLRGFCALFTPVIHRGSNPDVYVTWRGEFRASQGLQTSQNHESGPRRLLSTCDKASENQSEMDGRTHTNNSPQQDTHGHHWVSARAMSAHFFTSLHPCFTESDTCDGVGKQGLVRHSQSPLRPVFESHDSQYIDRKTRRSPCRWSHSLTLPRAPRTVRTAFYIMCRDA